MRKTEWKLKGHTFTLCLNAAALTDIYDRFGTEKDIPDLYLGSDKASFVLAFVEAERAGRARAALGRA